MSGIGSPGCRGGGATVDLGGSAAEGWGGGRSGGAVIGCASGAALDFAAAPSGGAKLGAGTGAVGSVVVVSVPNFNESVLVGEDVVSPLAAGLLLFADAPLPDEAAPLSGSDEQPAAASSPASNQPQPWRITLESNDITNLLGIIAASVPDRTASMSELSPLAKP
jgi:hypothetical protein